MSYEEIAKRCFEEHVNQHWSKPYLHELSKKCKSGKLSFTEACKEIDLPIQETESSIRQPVKMNSKNEYGHRGRNYVDSHWSRIRPSSHQSVQENSPNRRDSDVFTSNGNGSSDLFTSNESNSRIVKVDAETMTDPFPVPKPENTTMNSDFVEYASLVGQGVLERIPSEHHLFCTEMLLFASLLADSTCYHTDCPIFSGEGAKGLSQAVLFKYIKTIGGVVLGAKQLWETKEGNEFRKTKTSGTEMEVDGAAEDVQVIQDAGEVVQETAEISKDTETVVEPETLTTDMIPDQGENALVETAVSLKEVVQEIKSSTLPRDAEQETITEIAKETLVNDLILEIDTTEVEVEPIFEKEVSLESNTEASTLSDMNVPLSSKQVSENPKDTIDFHSPITIQLHQEEDILEPITETHVVTPLSFEQMAAKSNDTMDFHSLIKNYGLENDTSEPIVESQVIAEDQVVQETTSVSLNTFESVPTSDSLDIPLSESVRLSSLPQELERSDSDSVSVVLESDQSDMEVFYEEESGVQDVDMEIVQEEETVLENQPEQSLENLGDEEDVFFSVESGEIEENELSKGYESDILDIEMPQSSSSPIPTPKAAHDHIMNQFKQIIETSGTYRALNKPLRSKNDPFVSRYLVREEKVQAKKVQSRPLSAETKSSQSITTEVTESDITTEQSNSILVPGVTKPFDSPANAIAAPITTAEASPEKETDLKDAPAIDDSKLSFMDKLKMLKASMAKTRKDTLEKPKEDLNQNFVSLSDNIPITKSKKKEFLESRKVAKPVQVQRKPAFDVNAPVFISKKAVVGSPVQIQERLNSDSMNDSSNQFQVSAVPSSVAKEHQNEILGEFVSLQNTNVDTSGPIHTSQTPNGQETLSRNPSDGEEGEIAESPIAKLKSELLFALRKSKGMALGINASSPTSVVPLVSAEVAAKARRLVQLANNLVPDPVIDTSKKVEMPIISKKPVMVPPVALNPVVTTTSSDKVDSEQTVKPVAQVPTQVPTQIPHVTNSTSNGNPDPNISSAPSISLLRSLIAEAKSQIASSNRVNTSEPIPDQALPVRQPTSEVKPKTTAVETKLEVKPKKPSKSMRKKRPQEPILISSDSDAPPPKKKASRPNSPPIELQTPQVALQLRSQQIHHQNPPQQQYQDPRMQYQLPTYLPSTYPSFVPFGHPVALPVPPIPGQMQQPQQPYPYPVYSYPPFAYPIVQQGQNQQQQQQSFPFPPPFPYQQ